MENWGICGHSAPVFGGVLGICGNVGRPPRTREAERRISEMGARLGAKTGHHQRLAPTDVSLSCKRLAIFGQRLRQRQRACQDQATLPTPPPFPIC